MHRPFEVLNLFEADFGRADLADLAFSLDDGLSTRGHAAAAIELVETLHRLVPSTLVAVTVANEEPGVRTFVETSLPRFHVGELGVDLCISFLRVEDPRDHRARCLRVCNCESRVCSA